VEGNKFRTYYVNITYQQRKIGDIGSNDGKTSSTATSYHTTETMKNNNEDEMFELMDRDVNATLLSDESVRVIEHNISTYAISKVMLHQFSEGVSSVQDKFIKLIKYTNSLVEPAAKERILLKIGNNTIHYRDFDTLSIDEWLNDAIMQPFL